MGRKVSTKPGQLHPNHPVFSMSQRRFVPLAATERHTVGTSDALGIRISAVRDSRPMQTVYELTIALTRNHFVEAAAESPSLLVHNQCRFPNNPGQVNHIFRDAPGHLLDTPANRQLLLRVADDPATTLGTNRWGVETSAQMLDDGTQVWVQTLYGIVQNGGLNLSPRVWDSRIGQLVVPR